MTENSDPTVIIFGPDPDNKRRIGGVATAVRNLKLAVESVGSTHVCFYTDDDQTELAFLPTFVQRMLAVRKATSKLRKLPRGSYVAHANTSLYVKALLRDLPFLLACRAMDIPVLLQVHGGRLTTLRQTTIGRYVAKKAFSSAAVLGIHPGPQWDEFRAIDFGTPLVEMLNIVPVSEESVDSSTPQFLFLGRLVPEKGIMELIDAFEALAHDQSSAKLWIAGDGPMRRQVEKRIANSPVRDSIFFLGFVSGAEKQKIFARANVFVLPSTWQEGFPFSFLECAERGMACLVTTNSAIPKVFKDGSEFVSLDLSSPSDLRRKMQFVADSLESRERLGAAARTAVHRLCSPRVRGRELAKVYRDLSN